MMSRGRNYRSSLLVPLVLFCIFAVAATAVTVYAAKAYQKTSAQVAENYASRTAVAYVTEKIRQSQGADHIKIRRIGSDAIKRLGQAGSDEWSRGIQGLIISEEVDGQTYLTYIYPYQGSLMEYYTTAGSKLKPGDGSKIIEMKDMKAKWVDEDLLRITCIEKNGRRDQSYIYVPGR